MERLNTEGQLLASPLLKSIVNLVHRRDIDIQEKEYFMMTIKDALRRDWVCRVRVFEQYQHGLYALAPFEDARYFAEMGEETWRILAPTRIRTATQEIEFKDANGMLLVIEFRDILDIEIG